VYVELMRLQEMAGRTTESWSTRSVERAVWTRHVYKLPKLIVQAVCYRLADLQRRDLDAPGWMTRSGFMCLVQPQAHPSRLRSLAPDSHSSPPPLVLVTTACHPRRLPLTCLPRPSPIFRRKGGELGSSLLERPLSSPWERHSLWPPSARSPVRPDPTAILHQAERKTV
jgi:hypothetical protein